MNPMKMKILDDLLEYLAMKQGSDLKGLMDEENKPPEMEMMEGEPKGIEIEKVSVMGKEPGDYDEKANEAMETAVPEVNSDEPTDDELEELMMKLRG